MTLPRMRLRGRLLHSTVAGDLLSIAGGGDTMAALANAGSNDQFTYVSTAGGTFLGGLRGKCLPGVEALQIVIGG